MRILILEPNAATANALTTMFEAAGYEVARAATGAEALARITRDRDIDLLSMEPDLPDGDGVDILGQMRRQGEVLPVIAISRRNDTESIIRFFGHGGDDFISKPFHREEMLVRVAAVLRRTRSNAIKVGALTIDLDTCTAIADGKTLNLAKREHETLCILAEQFGKTLTGDMINRHLYGDEADQHPLSNIDAYICLLRKKTYGSNRGKPDRDRRGPRLSPRVSAASNRRSIGRPASLIPPPRAGIKAKIT